MAVGRRTAIRTDRGTPPRPERRTLCTIASVFSCRATRFSSVPFMRSTAPAIALKFSRHVLLRASNVRSERAATVARLSRSHRCSFAIAATSRDMDTAELWPSTPLRIMCNNRPHDVDWWCASNSNASMTAPHASHSHERNGHRSNPFFASSTLRPTQHRHSSASGCAFAFGQAVASSFPHSCAPHSARGGASRRHFAARAAPFVPRQRDGEVFQTVTPRCCIWDTPPRESTRGCL